MKAKKLRNMKSLGKEKLFEELTGVKKGKRELEVTA